MAMCDINRLTHSVTRPHSVCPVNVRTRNARGRLLPDGRGINGLLERYEWEGRALLHGRGVATMFLARAYLDGRRRRSREE
jgi:hypothetical protein